MIARLTGWYVVVFTCILAALSVMAYFFVGRTYATELQPALGTPEYQSVYSLAMRHVLYTIVGFDAPLLLLVGTAAYVLARTSITPLQQAQEREKRFAADVAHELRTPLATIATVAQAARVQDAEAKDATLEKITQEALEASGLIADLLTLTRSENRYALSCEPVDLAGVMTKASRDFVAQANERGVTLSLKPSGAVVLGDQRRLMQLSRNLFDNALRNATSSVVGSTWTDQRWAYLSVEDDGPAVPERLRDKVFERFFSARDDHSGTGLGLAICRWVARSHGGDVFIERSQFITRLPRMPDT